MDKKITEVYSYTEENNPYANGETISVFLVKDANYNNYIEINVHNDLKNGCSIFLIEEEVKALINKLKSNLV